jgi:hypothetical protein
MAEDARLLALSQIAVPDSRLRDEAAAQAIAHLRSRMPPVHSTPSVDEAGLVAQEERFDPAAHSGELVGVVDANEVLVIGEKTAIAIESEWEDGGGSIQSQRSTGAVSGAISVQEQEALAIAAHEEDERLYALSLLPPPVLTGSVEETAKEAKCRSQESCRTHCDTVQDRFCVHVDTPLEVMQNTARLNALCQSKGVRVPILRPAAHLRVRALLDWSAAPSADVAHVNGTAHFRGKDGAPQLVSNQQPSVGAFSETISLFRAKARCGEPFSLCRYGDGEYTILRNGTYRSPGGLIENWHYDPQENEAGHAQVYKLLKGGFDLAEQYGNMFLGLPFFFCAEGTSGGGIHGGGGNQAWLGKFRFLVKPDDPPVPANQYVHSWQWSNLNYPLFLSFLEDVQASGSPIIVVNGYSSDDDHPPSELPPWVWALVTVPASGAVSWFSQNSVDVEHSATNLAKSVNGFTFLFAAGPLSDMLIPLMTQANKQNSYVDVGGTLDWELKHVRSRDFHPRAGAQRNDTNYIQSGGALQHDQTCTETRWELELSSKIWGDP